MRHAPIALLALSLTSCQKIPDLGDVMSKIEDYTPKLSFQDFELKNLSWEGADVDFQFRLDNPNPVQLTLASLSYDLSLEGTRLLQGDQDKGMTLAASGSSTVTLPVSVKFADMLALVKDASGKDELGFALSGDFGFDTPLGRLKVPYSHEGKLPVLRAPEIQLEAFRMAGVDLAKQTAKMELDFQVENKQNAAYGFKGLDYSLQLNSKDAATGKMGEVAQVPAGQKKTVTLPIDLNVLNLGTTLIQSLVNKQAVEVRLKADLNVETPLGTLPLSFDRKKDLSAR